MIEQTIPLQKFTAISDYSELSNGLFNAHIDELGWTQNELPDAFIVEDRGLLVRVEKYDFSHSHAKYHFESEAPRVDLVILVFNYPKP